MRKPTPPSRYIVFGKPQILEADILEVVETIRSGWLGTGPKTALFEEKFRNYTHAPYAVAVNSCTAALFLALTIADIGPGDEVITTPITFSATANVIEHRGARPVFADVDRTTGLINLEALKSVVSPRTKAILPVHLAGRMCDMAAIMEFAHSQGLLVIEDAAHALESEKSGQHAGTFADFGAFSFYPTKSLTTAEGGMLCTSRQEWAEKARRMRLHGIDTDAWRRYSESGFRTYDTIEPGYKFNLPDLNAALGLHQFERLNRNLKHREVIWSIYRQGLSEIPGVKIPPETQAQNEIHARHLFSVHIDPQVTGVTSDEMMTRLHKLSIGTGIHYHAIHLMQYYREKYGYQRGQFPNAEWISDTTLSLPLAASMTIQDAEYVVKAFHYALETELG